jgi:SRSO17 transposase
MSKVQPTKEWSNSLVLPRGTDENFCHEDDASLPIDESRFLKKGHASVGVKRQWRGRACKVESCQVAVLASVGQAER